jgi:cyanophycinase
MEPIVIRIICLFALTAAPWFAAQSATAADFSTSSGAAIDPSIMDPAPCSFEPPAPVTGSLVICGGGKLPDNVLNRFLELAGGKQARVVIIPTASALADGPEIEQKITFFRNANVAGLKLLHTRSRSEADDPQFGKPLADATGVWFTGGFQWRLADTYLGTAIEKLVHAVLNRGGVIGGTSSGAAIMSTIMIRRANPDPEVGRGFDFLPGTVIDQHFLKRNRQDRLLNVLASHPGFVGLGIDEGTALIAQGRRLSVLGDSQVIACLAPSQDRPMKTEVLKSGDEVDLIALSRAAIGRAKPRKQPADVQAMPRGTLMLASGDDLAPAVAERFIQAAGGPDARLLVVTTAEREPPNENEATGWLKTAGARNVKLVYACDRSEALRPAMLKLFADAQGIWFTGGRPYRLVDAYLDSEAETLFHKVLERGGVIGGTDAGARIQASTLVRGTPLESSEIAAEGYENGFGFFRDVAIDDHFSDPHRFEAMARLKQVRAGLIGLGIDADTALVVHGNELEVLGPHEVAVFDRREAPRDAQAGYELLHAGERYNLKTRRRVVAAETKPADHDVQQASASKDSGPDSR